MENITQYLSIENFLFKYPNIYESPYSVLNPYNDQSFNDVIATKKEFSNLKLSKTEPITKKGTGVQYKHQKIITRFMNSKTPYNELLLFNEMGTGKTCTAVSVIESFRKTFSDDDMWKNIDGAVICAKGSSLLKNFVNELVFSCTDGRYIPENYERLTSYEKTFRVKKKISDFYETHTFETLAREMSKMTDLNIIKRFSNKIFVVDEVHNLREHGGTEDIYDDTISLSIQRSRTFRGGRATEGATARPPLNVYAEFHRLFHLIKESKILLLSGTVMKDDPIEFASVMNLILPLDKQLPTGKSFLKYFFDSPDGPQKLSIAIRGRISYLKAMISNVKKVFIENPDFIPPFAIISPPSAAAAKWPQHFKIYAQNAHPFQNQICLRAYNEDITNANIFINSRQAALFVFPDGSYGMEGFNTYIISTKTKNSMIRRENRQSYQLKRELVTAINANIENLYRYSCKYAHTIKTLLENPKSKSFVYCEFVNGGGCILFSKILQLFGYKEATGDEYTRHPRFALITNQTSTPTKIQKLIERFNADDNLDGDYISVIIGSKVISEGFTFKNIKQEFIFTPHWNYSETSQVIARGWRTGSHDDLIRRGDSEVQVSIYQYATICTDIDASIDLTMYKLSENKDIYMKKIELVVKKSAFDCPLTIERNKITGYNGMRECDYMDCDYVCDGRIGAEEDTSSYDFFYNNTEELYASLYLHFRTHFEIELHQISSMFPQMTLVEIIMSLKSLIDRSTQFINKFGHIVYLKIQKNKVFIVNDPKIPNNDVFVNYYNKNLLIKNGDSFSYELSQVMIDRLPLVIEQIFTPTEYRREMIAELPQQVQIILLQGCIEAKFKNTEYKVDIREQILEAFKGFFSFINEKWIVWLYNDVYNISVYNPDKHDVIFKKTGLWEVDTNVNIDEYLIQKQKKLFETPVGVYGLWNPHLKEFCLRELTTQKSTDLRKLNVGRRCNDWNLSSLVNLAARRMKIEPPNDFYESATLEDLIEISKSIPKKIFVNTDFEDRDVLRRIIYWSQVPRTVTCTNIKTWLEEKGLIEENFDCGTQKKQRGKYLT